MKTSTTVSALLSLTVCVCVHAGNFNIKDGHRNIAMGTRRLYPMYPVDTLLHNENPRMSSTMLRVKSEDVCYPKKGDTNVPKFRITAFNVTDLMPTGEGGYAFVTEGGIDSDKLCLHLKTKRGGSYSFNIDIWGYYI